MKRNPVAENGGSHYANRDAARRSIEMVLPLLETWRQDKRIVGSGFLYIVVMDPCRTPRDCDFEQAILYEHALGDQEMWDADYASFARAKAQLAWRTGADTHHLQLVAPHLLRESDTLLWGSACVDGIVVGVSGAFPWYDEVIAGVVALCLRAVAKEARGLEGSRVGLS